jgi:NAD(P)-dependent dehydrogenase (short-subunit alcohol dehydrogenase family)
MEGKMEFLNQVAVITGGAGGVGRAMALTFAQDGANVVILDVVDDAINNAVRELEDVGHQVLGIRCDIRNKREVEEAAEATINRFKKVDILVNNAFVFYKGPTEEMAEEDWDRLVDIGLKGTFLCSQAFGKYMIKQGKGKIVNIGALAPSRATPGFAAYGATKGGILALTKALAVEWAQFGITVNSVSPSMIDTPMRGGKTPAPELNKMIPLGHAAKQKDIADVVAFLVSSKAEYVTGQDIQVDGGLSAIYPPAILGLSHRGS